MPAYKRARATAYRRPMRKAPRARTPKHKTRTRLASSRTRKYTAPVSIGTQKRGGGMATMSMHQINDTCTRVVGRSYLGSVNNNDVATNANSNEIGLVFDINPTLLGDRLATLASTYDKYCYQSVKFTYVPQCPSSQPGSVVICFERDPQAILANPANSGKYMQEIMSYEHAVMTPTWVETAVSYKRDPHEYKTWFMSGDQANITTRETSQGLLLAYLTNVGTAKINTGFIVMDYVLDLVSPNILPSLASPITPTQFTRSSNSCLSITASATASTNTPIYDIIGAGVSQGDIIEAVYCGAAACTGFSYYTNGGGGGTNTLTIAKINPGDKIYIAVGVSNTTTSFKPVCIVTTNLSSALGSWTGTVGTAAGGGPATYPSGAMFPSSTVAGYNPFINIAGGTANSQWLFWRKIANTAQVDTA